MRWILCSDAQSIVSSLVGDVVMPVITVITGGISFSSWKLALTEGEEPSYLNYGNFITAVINFLLMAFIIFCFVKLMNTLSAKMLRKEERHSGISTFCKGLSHIIGRKLRYHEVKYYFFTILHFSVWVQNFNLSVNYGS